MIDDIYIYIYIYYIIPSKVLYIYDDEKPNNIYFITYVIRLLIILSSSGNNRYITFPL